MRHPSGDFVPDQFVTDQQNASTAEWLNLLPAAGEISTENCCYPNAATCPDCGSGMIRFGGCVACPACGLEGCGF